MMGRRRYTTTRGLLYPRLRFILGPSAGTIALTISYSAMFLHAASFSSSSGCSVSSCCAFVIPPTTTIQKGNQLLKVPKQRQLLFGFPKSSTSTTTISSRSSFCSSSKQNINNDDDDISSNSIKGLVEGRRGEEEWIELLPFEKGSHGSARIVVPQRLPQKNKIVEKRKQENDTATAAADKHSSAEEGNEDEEDDEDEDDIFARPSFQKRLEATIAACAELNKTSVWVDVPMSRASLIEDMIDSGLRYHHAKDDVATLNVWLLDTENKIPEYATHHVGVGAFVVNSRNELLCIRELRGRQILPWKIPGGLSDLGEQIDEAVVREVLEETGIETTFHSILGFRHAHGMANGRSDLYFFCRADPIEEQDPTNGNKIIPDPIPQETEIEVAAWVPLSEYRAMVNENAHPMLKQMMRLYDKGNPIERTVVESPITGRKNPIYYPDVEQLK